MSVEMMSQVWRLDVPPHVQSVLLVLANFADDDGGNVFPSIGRIAWQTGYSERQVYRIMGALRKDGVIRTTRRAHANHPAHYRLVLDGVQRKPSYRPTSHVGDPDTLSSPGDAGPDHTPDILSGVEDEPVSPLTPVSETPDTGVTPPLTPASETPDTGVTPPLTPVSPKPSVNRQREPAEQSSEEPSSRVRARGSSQDGWRKCTDCLRRLRPLPIGHPERPRAEDDTWGGQTRCEDCCRARASPAAARVGDLIRG